MKILMTGATGLIGKALGIELAKKGHQLIIVARNKNEALENTPFPCEIIEADLTKGTLNPFQVDGVEVIFNLMGEPIASGRWTDKKKKSLIESRVLGTKNLRLSFKDKPPKIMVSASAVGIYGDRGAEDLKETSEPATDFLGKLCTDWEAEAMEMTLKGTRVVTIRTGVVLSAEGGALAEMLPAFRAGVGGPLAGGHQWMSWIHHSDIVRIYIEAMENEEAEGPINAVSPQPITNGEFTKSLGKTIHRPVITPVPRIALKTIFGEKEIILTASQKVHPDKLYDLKFKFNYTTIDQALKHELKHLAKDEDLLVTRHYVPLKPEEVFPFFSEAKNLAEITPKLLDFKIESVKPAEMKDGTLIDYRLKVRGVPMHWKTKIESWNPPHQFVDNQLKGPYKLWHHTHQFEKLGPGTLMTDRVRYQMPLGFVGWAAAGWLVRKDVEEIFKYRKKQISKIFASK